MGWENTGWSVWKNASTRSTKKSCLFVYKNRNGNVFDVLKNSVFFWGGLKEKSPFEKSYQLPASIQSSYNHLDRWAEPLILFLGTKMGCGRRSLLWSVMVETPKNALILWKMGLGPEMERGKLTIIGNETIVLEGAIFHWIFGLRVDPYLWGDRIFILVGSLKLSPNMLILQTIMLFWWKCFNSKETLANSP